MEEFVVPLTLEEEEVRHVIEPLLNSEGFELVCLRLKKAQSKSLLMLFVDHLDAEKSISIENLEDISRLLSDVLDASFSQGNVLTGRYDLEVSSPGLDRPLTRIRHFKKALGEKVYVVMNTPDLHGAKKHSGVLVEANDDLIIIELDDRGGEKISLPYRDMKMAKIVFDFSRLSKSKGNPRK